MPKSSSDKYSLYESPLSEETIKTRRNSLIISALCLFMSYEPQAIPDRISALGVDLQGNTTTVAEALWIVCFYLFAHFLCAAGIEFTQWYRAIWTPRLRNKLLYKTMPISDAPDRLDPNDLDDVRESTRLSAEYTMTRRTDWYVIPLLVFRILFELGVPIYLGLFALIRFAPF